MKKYFFKNLPYGGNDEQGQHVHGLTDYTLVGCRDNHFTQDNKCYVGENSGRTLERVRRGKESNKKSLPGGFDISVRA